MLTRSTTPKPFSQESSSSFSLPGGDRTRPHPFATPSPDARANEPLTPQPQSLADNFAARSLWGEATPSATPLNPIQAATEPIQREDDDDRGPSLELLPPQLRLPIGPLDLAADTSSAQLGYRDGPLSAQAGYSYGGDIFAGMGYGDFAARLGVNPGSGALSLGGSYDQLRFGSSYDPSSSTFGASLGYGAPLLPMPGALSSAMYSGEAGLRGVMGGLPGALDDPLGFYQRQSGNIDAIAAAGGMLSDLGSQPHGPNFGAGLQITSSPEERFRLMAGVQGHF